MAKTANQRIDETLQTLGTVTLPKNGKVLAELVLIMKRWLDGNSADLARLSGLISLKEKDADATSEKRKLRDLRRAIKLVKLWQATLVHGISNESHSAVVDKIADAQLATALDAAVGEAYELKMMTSPPVLQEIFSELLRDPKAFLTREKLMVSGIAAPPAGQKLVYRFWYDLAHTVYKFEANASKPLEEYISKPAWIIPVTPFSTVKESYDRLVGAVVGDVNLALTTQFSGCSYCFQVSKDRKQLLAAHIDPERGRGESGESLSAKLRDGGGFQNGNDGVFRTFGRVKNPGADFGYGDGLTTIIAVKGSGGWALFSQTQTPAGKLEVKQIFNPAKKDA